MNPTTVGGRLHPMDASDDYASIVLGDHPTGYYRLNGTGTTALDSSGNGYTATVGASVTEGVAGLIAGSDTAMSFPGGTTSAGIVSVPEVKAMEAVTKVSLEAWLRFSTIPKTYTTAVAYGSDRAYAPYSLFFRAGGQIVAQFYLSTGVLEVPAPTTLKVNTIYHVVSTYDGTTGRIYVNGALAASLAKTGTLTGYIPNYGFTIGDDAQLEDPEFVGTIDEVAVYAGQVLTATQIGNHYGAGTSGGVATPSPTPVPSPTPTPTSTPIVSGNYPTVVLGDGPAAYYHLDDSGTTAMDASGHGLSGTIGSTVTKGAAGLVSSFSNAAMTFPGSATAAGVVNVPANASLQPASTLTLEAWMNFPSTPAAYTFVTGYGTDANYAPYGLFFHAGGQIVAQFYLSSGVLEVPSSVKLAANTTYYVAATFDGTTGRIYVNGTQRGSVAKTGTLRDYFAGYGFSIGDDAGKSDPAFKGTVDEVAVYTKALSATQIQNHYVAATTGGGATPTPSPTPTPSGPATDWLSFGYDLQRTGYNPNETSVNAGNVSALQLVWTFNVGSSMVHEPVYAANVDVSGTPTNIIYAGSLYGSTMYAINAATSAIVWQDPVPSASYSCGSGTSTFSIGETPAIDRAKNRLYFADGRNQVHAVNLATGVEATGWPITVANYTPDHNFMHGGLTYNSSNGLLYAVTGSTCDISPWYGRIVAIDTSGPSIVGTFFTMSGTSTQGGSGGGIWGPGGGTIVPTSDNVVIATGNADTALNSSQHAAYAEQIVELSSMLSSIVANNYPTNIPVLSGYDDFDFGATPLVFQPPGCPLMVAAENKSGMFELYDESTISSGPIQYVAMSIPSDEGSFVGAPAYDPATNYVYVGMPSTSGIYQPGLAAFSIAPNCTLNTTPVWSANFGPAATSGQQEPRSPLSIANGVVYVGNYTGDTLYAFNAATGAQLWTLALPSWGNAGTVIANGMVYVSAADGTIRAYAPPAQAQVLSKRIVKSSRSFMPKHRSAPKNSWAAWINE